MKSYSAFEITISLKQIGKYCYESIIKYHHTIIKSIPYKIPSGIIFPAAIKNLFTEAKFPYSMSRAADENLKNTLDLMCI